MNNKLRKQIIERDKICQLGELFGIPELTGIPCVDELEVHHKTYKDYGNESEDQLILVCRRCHEFITDYVRTLRHDRRAEYDVDPLPDERPTIQGNTRSLDYDYEPIQDNGRIAVSDAQRAARKSW